MLVAVVVMSILPLGTWAQSPCSNFIELIPRVEQVDAVCCTQPGACTGLTSSMALPAANAQCGDEACADAFIPFWDDCQEMARTMGFDAEGHDDFYTSCLEIARGDCGMGCTDLNLPCRSNEVTAACCSPPPSDEEIDNCVAAPCLNGGMCFTRLLSPSGYDCDCAEGYSGQTCEVATDVCTLEEDDCDIHAKCQHLGPGRHECTCQLGYESVAREQGEQGGRGIGLSVGSCLEIDECASSPCQNNGVCTDEFFGYSCACEGGWVGHNCQLAPAAEYCVPGTLVPSRCSIDCAAVMRTFATECSGPLARLDPQLQQVVATFDQDQCQRIGVEQFLDRIDILQIEHGCELSLAWQVYSATNVRVATVGVDPPESQQPVVNTDHAGGVMGDGFVEFEGPPSNQWITFEVHVPEAGEYALQFGYEPAMEDRPMQLSINGAVVPATQTGFAFDGLVHFPPAVWAADNAYMLTNRVLVLLQLGTNTVKITTTILSGASVNGLYLATGPPSSMAATVVPRHTGGGGHRRQQSAVPQPEFRPGSGNFLLEFTEDTAVCPWDTIDEKVATLSDACCRAAQPGTLCVDGLPDRCVWQCAVQIRAFLLKCPEFAEIAGATYSNTQADFGEQLSQLQENCLAAVDIGIMQETANAAQCSPETQNRETIG